MSEDNGKEIYVMRAGVILGPYASDEAAKLLVDGTIDRNSLARIGLEGRVFPAQLLAPAAELELHAFDAS